MLCPLFARRFLGPQYDQLIKNAAKIRPNQRRAMNSLLLCGILLNRNGLEAGTSAPSFRLPDLGGNELSLDLRGKRLLLVFPIRIVGLVKHWQPNLA